MSEKETIDVVRERVGLLYKNATSGIIITFLASSALTFGLDLSHGSPSRVTWWAVMILLLAARGLDGYLWRRRGEYSPNPHQDLFRFRMGVILTALCWCTYFLAFYDSLGIFELTSSMVIMSAMAGGATTVLSGDRLSATIYTQTLLIPNSLLLLADPNTTYKILGLLGVCFGIIMLSISKKTSSFLTHSIQLRFEHKKLLENLERIIESRTQEIIQLNQQDTLTKLLSRSAFLQESKKYINDQNPKEFALFFIDLNDFKPINDNFGHQIGDSVLESIAARLEQIPLKQKLACRWGGDEFIILCQVDPQDSVDSISKKISTTVSSLIFIESAELKINASIGVSLFPKHSKSINDLIAFADLAMYNNKNNKDPSNHTIFDFKLYEQASYEYFLGASIKNASTRKQLRIEAQPIFNCKSNQFDTVEVLLRWNLNGKNIPPDTFIPIAEKNGSINEIGLWVFDAAMREINSTTVQKHNLNICINVSALQLNDENFASHVSSLLTLHNYPASRLHIEITESVFAEDKETLKNTLATLQEIGIKISIDDFGTGYSSLSAIQKLNIDTIKIDKSFINNPTPRSMGLIKGILVIAKSFGYSTIAEGVETPEQADQLKKLGIDYLQGYYYSKPIPTTSLIKILEEQNLSPSKL